MNEAARLTDLAKRVEGRILASETTVLGATEDERRHWVTGRVMRLRGRDDAYPHLPQRSCTEDDGAASGPGHWRAG